MLVVVGAALYWLIFGVMRTSGRRETESEVGLRE